MIKTMRVDKWIWAVRMTKTRTLAAKFCDQGKVLINEQKCKGSKVIKVGDHITVYKESVLIYEVTGFIPKRVSAKVAAKHYIDRSPEKEPSTNHSSDPDWGRRAKGEGRPTKKDWRDLQAWKEDF